MAISMRAKLEHAGIEKEGKEGRNGKRGEEWQGWQEAGEG